jgi:AraC family L-rhamnose operon regulatory protein RhaS
MSRNLRGSRAIPGPSGQARKPEAGAELTSRPKYVTIPEFGVVVVESRHAVNWSGPVWFNEDFNKFLLVVSGAVQVRTPDKNWDLHQDSLVHVTAHAKHSMTDIPGEPVVLYVIHYREKVLPAPLAAALRWQSIHHWRMTASQSNAARLVRQDLQEMLFEQLIRREGWQALLISLLIRLAVRAMRMSERQPATASLVSPVAGPSQLRVANYAAALANDFYRQQSLDEAAAKAGLSRRRFTEVFRSLTGTSWRRHLLILRLKHGARLLMETRKSVTEVMFECGFEDPSHFNHHFKSYFGCSPQVYRKESSTI